MNITIPGARLPSWNHFYAGRHYRQRTEIKNEWHALVKEQLSPDVEMFTQPVHIRVHAYYKGNACDPDNVCAKLVIDPLKGRVIQDDTSEYVFAVTTTSTQHVHNGVVIFIDEVGEGE